MLNFYFSALVNSINSNRTKIVTGELLLFYRYVNKNTVKFNFYAFGMNSFIKLFNHYDIFHVFC